MKTLPKQTNKTPQTLPHQKTQKAKKGKENYRLMYKIDAKIQNKILVN